MLELGVFGLPDEPVPGTNQDILQNLDLPDLAEHGRGLPQYPLSIPNKPFSWRIMCIEILPLV